MITHHDPDDCPRCEAKRALLKAINQPTVGPFTRGGLVLSPGREITDPNEAEALGLIVEARRMVRDAWQRSVGLLPPLHIHTQPPTEES